MTPQVLLMRDDRNAERPVIVFRKGRKLYHAIAARDADVALVTFETLRGMRPLERAGEPYPPRKAASFWLNRDFRTVTKRAHQVLKGLVARKGAR